MKKNAWKILAAIISLAVMLSLSLVPVFADETDAGTGTAEVTEADTGAETDAGTEADTEADTADGTETAEGTGTETAEGTETSAATGSGSSSTTTQTKTTHYGLVTIIIVAVILVAFAIWALVNREKTAKLWRSFKSEFKKIVWADPHDTLKNTVLVVIAIVVFAAVLGVIDYLLSLLIVAIGTAI